MSQKWTQLPENYAKSDVYLANNWDKVVAIVQMLNCEISEAWNIGGPKVYEAQFQKLNEYPSVFGKLYLTKVHKTYDCDTFYPTEYIKNLKNTENSDVIEENGIQLSFHVYVL